MIQTYRLTKGRITVKVKKIKSQPPIYVIVPDSPCFLPSGTLIFENPKLKIVDDFGNEIFPAGKYLFTSKTIDPYHLVIDMF